MLGPRAPGGGGRGRVQLSEADRLEIKQRLYTAGRCESATADQGPCGVDPVSTSTGSGVPRTCGTVAASVVSHVARSVGVEQVAFYVPLLRRGRALTTSST